MVQVLPQLIVCRSFGGQLLQHRAQVRFRCRISQSRRKFDRAELTIQRNELRECIAAAYGLRTVRCLEVRDTLKMYHARRSTYREVPSTGMKIT